MQRSARLLASAPAALASAPAGVASAPAALASAAAASPAHPRLARRERRAKSAVPQDSNEELLDPALYKKLTSVQYKSLFGVDDSLKPEFSGLQVRLVCPICIAVVVGDMFCLCSVL